MRSRSSERKSLGAYKDAMEIKSRESRGNLKLTTMKKSMTDGADNMTDDL